MRYINVGSGSKGNSTIIYNSQTVLLIDCGITKKRVTVALASIGKTLTDITAVLVTHRHSDHTACMNAFAGLEPCLFSGDEGILDTKFKDSNHLHPFQELLEKTFAVTALPTSHDAPESMGYLIKDTESKERMLYMTDTGYIPAKDLALAGNCDFYILESNHDPEMLMHSSRSNWLKMRILGDKGHLSNEQASHYLSLMIGGQTKEIAMAHLSEECNTPALALQTFRDVMLAQTGAVPAIVVKTLSQHDPTTGGDIILGGTKL